MLIVAIDRGPSGFVINVLIDDGQDLDGARQVLAPIGWEQLRDHIGEVLSDGADISPHLDSYADWKQMAQNGKAGFWTCSPEQVLATVRKGAGG